mgnify:CR=1 FL=1
MNIKTDYSDIKWKDKLIRIVQDKTDVEHWSPMSNAVGNALYKYIREGRPKVDGETHIFLSMAAPQTANARVHRYFYAVDQDFYMQFVYDDESGVYAFRLLDWDGEVYGEWVVNL